MNKNRKIIQVRLSEAESFRLTEIVRVTGRKATELIRSWLQDAYNKEFPPYKRGFFTSVRDVKEKSEWEKMSLEQRCERTGGFVDLKERQKVCCFGKKTSLGFSGISVPLDRFGDKDFRPNWYEED